VTRPALAASAAYVLVILAANYLTAWFGLVPAGFGLLVTAGTYAAGLALLARDVVQREAGLPAVVACIAAGGILSWWLATPRLAVASVVAFLLAESLDTLVFTPLERHGWNRAVIASNVVGAIVDTFVFLELAGYPITRQTVGGQLLVKIGYTTLVVLAVAALIRWGVRRAVPVAPDRIPEGA
jgi:queuosine precursor transporter